MKKLASITLVAIFATFALTSCKKDHTCTCTISGAHTIPNSSKKDAQTACDSWNTLEIISGGTCHLD